MIARVVGLFCIVAFVAPALAQTSRPAEEFPYTAAIDRENVNIRSGPAMTAYACAMLSKPAAVEVVGKSKDGEWLEVKPPAGAFSVTPKNNLQVDGKVGTVIADEVFVRPGGPMRTKDFWAVHGKKLKKGDKVNIIGQVDEFYKIERPPGANYYVSAQMVSGHGDAIAAAGNGGPRVTGPTTHIATTRRTDVTITKWTSSTTQPGLSPETADALMKLSKEFTAAVKDKKYEEIDVQGWLDRFNAMKTAATDPAAAKWIDYYVEVLHAMQKSAKSTASRDTVVAEYDSFAAAAKAKRDQLAEQPLPDTKVTKQGTYDAMGVLSASALFTGGATGPKRYISRDPLTNKMDAWVQCTSGKVDLAAFVGKYVGVIGKSTYDTTLRSYIVDAESVVLLGDAKDAGGTATPKPVVSERTPAAKPTVVAPAPKPPVEPPAVVAPKPEPMPELPPEIKVVPAPDTKTEVPAGDEKPDMSGKADGASGTTKPAGDGATAG